MGYLDGYGWVWVDTRGCANILSEFRVSQRSKVTRNDNTGEYTVHALHGPMRFVRSKRGLHYYDTRQDRERHESHATGAASGEAPPVVPTIADNVRRFKATASDLRRADRARVIEAVLGFPSPAT